MTLKKIVFILNPISGTGKQKKAIPIIEKYLDRSKYEYKILKTEYAGHASEIAQQAVQDKADIVVAIGGDGTINESFQALVNTELCFGIVPCGSGNGMARHLKIPRDLKKAIDLINKGNTRKIDSCSVNDRPFLSIAGVGFDAHIAKLFDEAKFDKIHFPLLPPKIEHIFHKFRDKTNRQSCTRDFRTGTFFYVFSQVDEVSKPLTWKSFVYF